MSAPTNSILITGGYVLSADRVFQWIVKRLPELRVKYQPATYPGSTPIPSRGVSFYKSDITDILKADNCYGLFTPQLFLKANEKHEKGILMISSTARQRNRTATDFDVLEEIPKDVQAKKYLLRELGIEDNELKWASTCTLDQEDAHIALKWPEVVYHATSGIGLRFAGVAAVTLDKSNTLSPVDYVQDADGMVLPLIMPNSKVPFYNRRTKLKVTPSSKWNGGLQAEFCRIKPDCGLTMDAVGPLSNDPMVPATTFCLALPCFDAADPENHPPVPINIFVHTSLDSKGMLLAGVKVPDRNGDTKAKIFITISVSEHIGEERVQSTV